MANNRSTSASNGTNGTKASLHKGLTIALAIFSIVSIAYTAGITIRSTSVEDLLKESQKQSKDDIHLQNQAEQVDEDLQDLKVDGCLPAQQNEKDIIAIQGNLEHLKNGQTSIIRSLDDLKKEVNRSNSER